MVSQVLERGYFTTVPSGYTQVTEASTHEAFAGEERQLYVLADPRPDGIAPQADPVRDLLYPKGTDMERWTPRGSLSPEEKMPIKRLTRARTLFGT